eukprot:9335551-Karenia_brevis.AAC.1
MTPTGNDDCGTGEMAPTTLNCEPQILLGHIGSNTESEIPLISIPMTTLQEGHEQYKDLEEGKEFMSTGLCPWLSD